MGQSLTDKAKELQDLQTTEKLYSDPIKSHDGMDINPFSGMVESTGYGFKQAVADDTVQAFLQDIEDDKEISTRYKDSGICR